MARLAPTLSEGRVNASPLERHALLVGAIVICVCMMVQIPAVGAYLAVAQVLAALLLFLFSPAETARIGLAWWPLLALPIFAALSAFWSSDPDISLRYGAQFVFTAFLGVFLAARLSPENLVRVLFWSGLIFLIGCLLYPRLGPSAQGVVLIGLAGSKNSIGFFMQTHLLAASYVLIAAHTMSWERLLALVSLPASFFLLYQSNATTPLLIAAAGLPLLIAALVLRRATRSGRLAALVSLAVLASPFFVVGDEISRWIEDFTITALGKDPTLTGRTLLWEKAQEMIALRPWFGHGFSALWLGESAEAVGLRSWTGMADARGFNFHNSFLQVAADLGWVGLSIFVATLGFVGARWLSAFVTIDEPARIFFLVLLATLAARLPTEVLLGAFNPSSLWFFAAARLVLAPPSHGTLA